MDACQTVVPGMSDRERKDAIRSHELEKVPFVYEDSGRDKNTTWAVCAACRRAFLPESSAELATWMRGAQE